MSCLQCLQTVRPHPVQELLLVRCKTLRRCGMVGKLVDVARKDRMTLRRKRLGADEWHVRAKLGCAGRGSLALLIVTRAIRAQRGAVGGDRCG